MSKIPIYSQSSRRHVRAIAVITALIAVGIAAPATVAPAVAQEKKPNILFIMGDDIGWMQPSGRPHHKEDARRCRLWDH